MFHVKHWRRWQTPRARIRLPPSCSRARGCYGGVRRARCGPNVGENQGQCGRRHAVDSGRLAEGLRPNARQLLDSLVRQAVNAPVVERRGQLQYLVPSEGANVGILAVKIACILRIDFQLLDAPGGKLLKLGPNLRELVKPDAGQS